MKTFWIKFFGSFSMDAPKILYGEIFFGLKLYEGAFNKHLYPEKHDYIYMEWGFINFKLLYIQELKSKLQAFFYETQSTTISMHCIIIILIIA